MDRPPTDVGRQNPLGLRTLSGDRRPQFTSGLPKEGGDFAGVTSKGPVSPPQTNESGEGMKKFPPDLERHVGGGPVGRGAACMTGDTGRARDRGLVIPDLEEASSKTRVHNVGGGSLKEFAMPFDQGRGGGGGAVLTDETKEKRGNRGGRASPAAPFTPPVVKHVIHIRTTIHRNAIVPGDEIPRGRSGTWGSRRRGVTNEGIGVSDSGNGVAISGEATGPPPRARNAGVEIAGVKGGGRREAKES